MTTFVIAALAAVAGALGGLALGAQLSRAFGSAPREDVIAFASLSVAVTGVTIVTAFLL